MRICLNPVSGREIRGDMRPVLVLSPKEFNRLGLTIVAPISQGGDYSRYAGFAATLMGSGTQTLGVVLVNMLRSVDLGARAVKFVEKAPAAVLQDAMGRIRPVLEI